MTTARTLVVAVEDLATAGIVGAEAGRLAAAEQAETIVLLHVLDQHTFLNGMLGIAGYGQPVLESEEEGRRVLTLAEQVLRAELTALNAPIPAIRPVLMDGAIGEAIATAARDHGADLIVLGARRPHAFGRLTHPDVRAALAPHVPCRMHVASLQDTGSKPEG